MNKILQALFYDLVNYRSDKLKEVKKIVLSQQLKLQRIKFRLPKYIKPENTDKEEEGD